MALAQFTDNPEQIQQFDFSVDLLQTILWQYNEAQNLQALLQAEQDWYTANQQEFWENWITDVFDLRSANDFGLSVWSQILRLPLYVSYQPSPLSKPTFGFDVAYFKNFDRGNFSEKNGGANNLPTEIKRLALRLRYFQLVSSGTVPETNRFLNEVFVPGTVYLLDHLNMTQTYVFRVPIDANLKYLLDNFDILPRPAGVSSNYISTSNRYFGFGPYQVNYDRGNFGA